MFTLCSDLTIGNFRFSGVNEIVITRSIHNLADTAVVNLPSLARISRKGETQPNTILTGDQFSDGDPVTIRLGYNNELLTEFSGFVRKREKNVLLQVVCEGYSWLLRRNACSGFYAEISVQDILKSAISGVDPAYPISIQCQADFTLANVDMDGKSGFDLINGLYKYTDGCLACFFIEPATLWCGLVYSGYAKGTDLFNAGTVSYRPGYNTPAENTLGQRFATDDPVLVTYQKKMPNGATLFATSGSAGGNLKIRNKVLNHIADQPTLEQLAVEKSYQLNYVGCNGWLPSFLDPFCAPGYLATLVDDRNPALNGTYLVESTKTTFGQRGARRNVTPGPLTGFANK